MRITALERPAAAQLNLYPDPESFLSGLGWPVVLVFLLLDSLLVLARYLLEFSHEDFILLLEFVKVRLESTFLLLHPPVVDLLVVPLLL